MLYVIPFLNSPLNSPHPTPPHLTSTRVLPHQPSHSCIFLCTFAQQRFLPKLAVSKTHLSKAIDNQWPSFKFWIACGSCKMLPPRIYLGHLFRYHVHRECKLIFMEPRANYTEKGNPKPNVNGFWRIGPCV